MYLVLSDTDTHTVGETPTDIVNAIFKWHFNEHRQLVSKRQFYLPVVSGCSWGECFTEEELRKEAIRYLWKKLDDLGYRKFKQY